MALDEWICAGLPEDVVNAAIDWVVVLDDAPLQPAQRIAFFDWLDADPNHRWAYEEISQAWGRTQSLQALSHELKRSEVIAFPTANPRMGIASSVPTAAGLDRIAYWTTATIVLAGLLSAVL